ncbi:MAG TPA: hypothetical protein VK737_06070 [Opitutales bacterium]|jgi:hypothetical protein|nr:hypothetical protein [Opitutales bacterium]
MKKQKIIQLLKIYLIIIVPLTLAQLIRTILGNGSYTEMLHNGKVGLADFPVGIQILVIVWAMSWFGGLVVWYLEHVIDKEEKNLSSDK